MSDDDNEDYYDRAGVVGDEYYENQNDGDGEDETNLKAKAKTDDEDEDEDADEDIFGEDPVTAAKTVTSKEGNYVYGSQRITGNIMHLTDLSRLASSLAHMYSLGLEVHPVLLKSAREKGIYDPLDLAILHIGMREVPCPIYFKRHLRDGSIEIWTRDEMILPSELDDYLIR